MERNNQLNEITNNLIKIDPKNITKTLALFSAAVATILATASRGEAGERELQLQLAQGDSPYITLAILAFGAGVAYLVIRDVLGAHRKQEAEMGVSRANRQKLMSLPDKTLVKYRICYHDPEYFKDCYSSGASTAEELKISLGNLEGSAGYDDVRLESLEA